MQPPRKSATPLRHAANNVTAWIGGFASESSEGLTFGFQESGYERTAASIAGSLAAHSRSTPDEASPARRFSRQRPPALSDHRKAEACAISRGKTQAPLAA